MMFIGRWLVLVVFLAATSGSVGAQVTPPDIPAGSIVNQSVLWIYNYAKATSAVVNAHRITAAWDEHLVTWNSFGGAYDASIVGSFTVPSGTAGWNNVDVTALVQGWVDGTNANYGILLEQGQTAYTKYISSEAGYIPGRPYLEVWYTPPGGVMTYVVIKRPATLQDGVADTYIWALNPDTNYGANADLYTGLVGGFEKQTLLWFDMTVTPGGGPGTGTPGYWKNHPEAWPVEQIDIGGTTYTKEEAIGIMWMKKSGDKSLTLFAALVCAKLNVVLGNNSSCVDNTITLADAWMSMYPAGSVIEGSSSAWMIGEPLYIVLDSYNNGLLCAPHRD